MDVYPLSPRNPFFFVASDGVYQFLTSQNIVDLICLYDDPQEVRAGRGVGRGRIRTEAVSGRVPSHPEPACVLSSRPQACLAVIQTCWKIWLQLEGSCDDCTIVISYLAFDGQT